MKKRFFQRVAIIVALVMIISCGAPAVFAGVENTLELTSVYDAETADFTIKGKLPKNGKNFITVIIAPAGSAVDSYEAIADDSVMLKTVQTPVSGDVDITITIPEGDAVRYDYYIDALSLSKNGVFAVATADDVASVASAVNGKSAADIKKALSDDGSAVVCEGDDLDYISVYLHNTEPEGGYTKEEFVSAYMAAAGLALVANDSISLGEFFDGYAQYLEKDYGAQYDAQSKATQENMKELYEKYPVEESFGKTFEINMFVAKYKAAESAADLQKLVLEFFEKNGYDLDDYEDIGNSVYKEKVFDALYSNKGKVDNLGDIEEAFDKEVDKQADKASDTSSGSSGGGSKGGGTTGSISAAPVVQAPVEGAVFTDMAGHWAKDNVAAMYEKGIINGFPDGTFRPGQNVTRAEFAKMIASVLGLDTNYKADFADVAQNSWYTGYVAAVVRAGIANGTGEGTFEPEKYITRQDAAVMLARVLDYKAKNYPVASIGFNDEASIATYALNAVNGLANLGLINGYNGGFAPVDNTTRAEAAALLYRVAEYIR